jgi:competence protein ComFC
MLKSILNNFLLDILFPKFCLCCKREGSYLCQDCLSVLEIMENSFCLCENPVRLAETGKCRKCQRRQLAGLYFAVSYKNNLVKNLIHQFKYEPYIKGLSVSLALIIITHFDLIQKNFEQGDYVLIPVPLAKKRLKGRGFNQSEEIAKELSGRLGIPLFSDALLKIKSTAPQTELAKEERLENIRGVFSVENAEKIKNKKILLVDDVYTTGSTMEECSRILKDSGAKEVWGVAAARGE